MELIEAVKIALQSLWANKLRSILTLMGVMIGVAAVIMVITLVNGANKFVSHQGLRLRCGRLYRLQTAVCGLHRRGVEQDTKSAKT